ncbi:hypothetical protein SDC9_201219 [bioreactor metagenome]|uniref:Uncharacterized protein n=1 Tax=bioreactor metagenome TaxID=1076179 RepID=A0A645IQB8_9ZZZZ
MEESFCSFCNGYKCAEIHYFHHFSFVNFSYNRYESDFVDRCNGCVDVFSAHSGNLDSSDFANFFNRNHGFEIFLHLLNDFSTRSDYRTNEVFWNFQNFHFRSVWFHIGSWFIDGFQDFS